MTSDMDRYLFADEAGCFTFNRGRNVSKYFILCTVTMNDRGIATGLFDLRRDLVRRGAPLLDYFHATEDKQEVRDAVYDTILRYEFRVQVPLPLKTKQPCRHRSLEGHLIAGKFRTWGWNLLLFVCDFRNELVIHVC